MKTRQEIQKQLLALLEAEALCKMHGAFETIVPDIKLLEIPPYFEYLVREFPTAFLAGMTLGRRRALAWVLEVENTVKEQAPWTQPVVIKSTIVIKSTDDSSPDKSRDSSH